MPTLLLHHADHVLTMDATRREFAGGGLFARDGIIETVGPDHTLPQSADVIVDLSGQILLPGLVNCHHHLDQTLTRVLPAAQNAGLFDWLRAQYRLWATRTPEMSHDAAMIGLAELALSGCTTAFDHAYVFRNGCRVDDQIEAAQKLGLRFMISRGSLSLGESAGGLPPDECVEDERSIAADCERVIARYHDPAHGAMLRIVLAPCSPFSVTPHLLVAQAALARQHDVKLHTHLCETQDEADYTRAHYGKSPVAFMDKLGWLAPDVWFAHAVHVEDNEIAQFARHGVGVCHCPTSNMRLGSGIAPLRRYIDARVRVGLGVDGSASNDSGNLLAEMRQAMLAARVRRAVVPGAVEEAWVTAREVLAVATIGGASVLGRDDIGALEVGRCADAFTLDLNTVGYAGALQDPVAAVVFCAPQPARHVFVHGRSVVRDGRIVTVDMEQAVSAHNRNAARLRAG